MIKVKKSLVGGAAGATAPPQQVYAGDLRVQKDLAELDEMSSDPSFKVEFADKKNIRDAVVVIRPQEGLWRGACVRFSVKFEPMYPHVPPAVLCLTKLYHPNIGLDGKVCLNILRVGHVSASGADDGWKPVFTLYTVIMGFLTLFSAADPTDPLNIGAAKEMRENVERFKQNVVASLGGSSIRIEVVDSAGATRTETVAFPRLYEAAAGGGGGGGK